MLPVEAEAEFSAGAPAASPLGADPVKPATGPAAAPSAPPAASGAAVVSCWLPASDASGFAASMFVGPAAPPVLFVTGSGTAFPAPFAGVTMVCVCGVSGELFAAVGLPAPAVFLAVPVALAMSCVAM